MADQLYDIQVARGNGETIALSTYKGQTLLIVNVASACGFTPQYAGLEALYKQFKDQGLRVLAFPCNDFGAQEPGTAEEIAEFCSLNYGVTFDLFAKLEILGDNKHPLYTYLTENAEPSGDVKWNFEKFLISKEGQILGRYGSRVAPEDEEFRKDIQAAL